MNFRHQRSSARAGSAEVDYSTLVASVMSRQASSRTVRALLYEKNGVDSRIDFFARHGANAPRHARGPFLPTAGNGGSHEKVHAESTVNLADSRYGKDVQIDPVQPELQVAERGTEF